MWEIDFAEQITSFFYSIVLGGIFGLLYDFFHIPVRGKDASAVAMFVIDVLYFAFIGVVNFCFLLAVSNGFVRGYLLFGDFVGFLVYKKTLSSIIALICSLTVKPVKAVFYGINKAFFAFSNLVWKLFLNVGKKISKNIKKILKKG